MIQLFLEFNFASFIKEQEAEQQAEHYTKKLTLWKNVLSKVGVLLSVTGVSVRSGTLLHTLLRTHKISKQVV